MQPWPKTFTYWLRGEAEPLRLIVEKAHVVTASQTAKPGEVLVASKDQLSIATREGALVIDQIQPAGKRVLPTEEFLRGYGIEPGQCLGSEAP